MAKTAAKKPEIEIKGTAGMAGEDVGLESKKPEPKAIDLSDPTIQTAITEGQALIKDGKSKADAARAIYDLLESQGKEVIVAAFVAGATLTEKGALTYWYNCKRKKAKEQAKD
jgi:hypothetical protein